mgnify:CR=1 FL=1|tara:strand:+ start:186 stop:1619 length:1434 start_codon:yes stop_codon:yes gene_type:complete
MIHNRKPLLATTRRGFQTKHRSSVPVVSPRLAELVSSSSGSRSGGPEQLDETSANELRRSALTPQIVLNGLDTLTITAGGVVSPTNWLIEQQYIWSEYQKQYQFGDDYSTIEMDNKWWVLYPNGSLPYKFQLRNDEVGFIKIWSNDKWSSGAPGKQQVHITFYSKFLHSTNNIIGEVKNILKFFFTNVDDVCIQISRADLHLDITNGSTFLSQEQVDNVITRCKVREQYYEDNELILDKNEIEMLSSPGHNNKGGQKLMKTAIDKLMKMYHQQYSVGSNNTIRKRDLETAYFGKKSSSVWCKFYNKTKEVVKKNDDDTPLLWYKSGWNGDDTVVRVEFSMRRDFLKELDDGKYITLQMFMGNIDLLWDYLTTKWLRMVDVVKHNNSTTSVISKFWIAVQNGYKKVENNIIRKKTNKSKLNQLWKQALGCLNQMSSIGMSSNDDYSYVRSIIGAVENTMLDCINDGEYLHRRKLLGIA